MHPAARAPLVTLPRLIEVLFVCATCLLFAALEPDGTVVAGGIAKQVPGGAAGNNDWLVVKLGVADGAILASYSLAGTAGGGEALTSIAVGPARRTVVGGSLLDERTTIFFDDDDPDFAVLHFAEALDGKILTVRDGARELLSVGTKAPRPCYTVAKRSSAAVTRCTTIHNGLRAGVESPTS